MKFSFVLATLFALITASFALPLFTEDFDDLMERSLDVDDYELIARDVDDYELIARDLDDLADEILARTGAFTKLTGSAARSAKNFVHGAHKGGQLASAAAHGNSAKTAHSNNAFHLDRQQPANAAGQRKVAVQLNNVKKGQPSTVGQVAIHGNANPSSSKVNRKLKHSVSTGRETHINHPSSKKAKNIAANKAAQQNKASRNQAKAKAGKARAAAGVFKKGRK